MKKQLLTIILFFTFTIPAIAATIKPFSIVNNANYPILAGVVSDAKMDLRGTILGIAPLATGQSWNSSVIITNPANFVVGVIEDDGIGVTDIFDFVFDITPVCTVSGKLTSDSDAVFHNAIVTNSNPAITPGAKHHECAISSDEKSLEIR